MNNTEFELMPFTSSEMSDEMSWEDERGRGPSRGRAARPAPARPRPRPGPPQRPPQRPAPRRPRPASGAAFVAPSEPCICPAHGSEYVRWVQSALNRIDNAGLTVNGAMSPVTRSALRAFQTRQGLLPDGIAGPDTEQALRDAQRPAAGSAPDAASEPASAEFELSFEDAGEDEFETLAFESPGSRPTLRQGSRGTAVADLQRRLGTAGFSAGAADGIFGSNTDAAVRAFQRVRGLVADGVVGSRTWAALLGTSPVISGGGSSSTNEWVLPPSVSAAGDAQTVRYDSPPPWIGMPGNCTGSFTEGAATLKSYILATFAGVSSIGGYSCRANTANPSETSVHGTGRALDIMISPIGGRANSAVGDLIANWLVRNAAAIGVQYIIWNRVRWSGSRTPRVARYTGPNPHIDHVHVELNAEGAARRTSWFRDHELADDATFELQQSSLAEINTLETGLEDSDRDRGSLAFENKKMFGGIWEKDYLHWAQFSLNMYFKKNGGHTQLVENGLDSTAFRDAVAVFNKQATKRPKNREFDRKTQDTLVRENERNAGYLAWLRRQFETLGYQHLTTAYAPHEKPAAAIKEFQRDHDGKFGLTLASDGWTGAKTHLAILQAIKGLKPKKRPLPPSTVDETDWEAFLDTKLRQLGDYFDSQRPLDQDSVYFCVMQKLARKGVEDYVAMGVARLGSTDPPPKYEKLRHLLISDLKKGYARGNISTFWNRFKIHVDNATNSLRAILFRVTGQDLYDPGWNSVARDLKSQAQHKSHVYSCAFFRQFIELM